MRKSIIRRFFFSILFLVFLSSPVLGKEVGDLVYRDAAWAFSLFTGSPGHVGIYIGLSGDDSDPQVIEALAFEEPYAIQKNSMQSFLNANTYKGSKTTKTLPTYIQRRDIVNYAKSIVGLVFTYYDANHLNQKGKDSNGDGFEDEFDCVGLAERAYENVGLNPVIDEGAFITPKEQFESDRMGNVPTNLPSNPTRCSETYGTQSDYWQSKVNNPDFNWSGDYDEDSDIHGYYYYWGTSSSGTSTSYTTFAGYDPSSVGTGTYYLRVRAKDKANNYASSWDTIFVFRYDGNDPIPQPSSISVSNGVAVSPSTVTLGENFTVTFSLKERFGESKTFDQIAVAILRDDGSHVFDFAVWDNITISGYGTWTQSVENYLYAASSEGIYKAVIRGKETGGEWFDFGTVESGENPKSFIATKQGEGDDPDDPDPDDDVHIVSQEIRVYKDGSFVPELYFTLDPGQTIFLETEGKVKNEGSNDLKDVDIDHRVDASKDRFDENDTNMGDDKDDIDRGDIEVSHSPRITIEVANDGRSVYVKGDGSGERFSLIENRITLYFFLDVESENDKDISSPHVRQEYAKVNIIVREMIPPEEREALVALYDSTNGSGWTNNSNWKTDSDPCSWYGVSCSDGHVTSLMLDSNELSGSIPPKLGNLTNLTILWLYENQLTGAIPPELGNLTNLTQLILSANQLTGAIPPELGNLTSLTTLWLNENQLTGAIPSELGNLTNLTQLFLSANQLTGAIPPELGNLSNLTELWLYKNQLTGAIPPELGNLTNLTELYLIENQLTGAIPSELGNLSNLTKLSLVKNQLSGAIPPELGNLTNLTRLYLEANQLTGVIPSELGNLTNLAKLSLYENQLTGAIPFELGNLINLTNLGLHNNQLEGPVTEEIIKLTNLIDNQSNFCGNYLYTFNPKVKTFLNSKQIGDDWERCQNKNGDLNRDGNIDLRDPIDELKLLSGMLTGDKILKKYDINIDGKIGLEEATYSLQIVADERLPITNKKLVITFESNDVMPTWNESKKEWYYYLTYTVYNPNDFPVEILAWGQFNECLSNIEECTEDPLNFQKWLTSCGHGSMYVPAKGYACDTSWWMSGYACNGDETGNYAVWYKDEAGNAQVSVSENLTLRQTPSND